MVEDGLNCSVCTGKSPVQCGQVLIALSVLGTHWDFWNIFPLIIVDDSTRFYSLCLCIAGGALAEGFQARLQEFQNFEQIFEVGIL